MADQPTIWNVLYRAISILRAEHTGIATGGSATTLVDSALAEPDDSMNGGTIFIHTGNNAKKSRVITTWDLPTTTFTFPTMTTAIQVGAYYSAFDNRYTRAAMVQAIMRAMRNLPLGDQVPNDTTVTTEDTESYVLDPTVSNIRRVQIATSKVEPYCYGEPRHDWKEMNGYLWFEDFKSIPPGYLMRIIYQPEYTAHEILDDATLPQGLRPERIAAEAAYWAAYSRSGLAGSSDPETERDLNLALSARNEARVLYPILKTPKDSRYISLP